MQFSIYAMEKSNGDIEMSLSGAPRKQCFQQIK